MAESLRRTAPDPLPVAVVGAGPAGLTAAWVFDEKSLGQKTGKGFYEYKGDKYERINLTEQEAAKYNPVALLAVAANNAAWLISNGVCSREDLEKALRLGMGLKKELFATMHDFGAGNVVKALQDLAARHGPFYEPDPYLVSQRT